MITPKGFADVGRLIPIFWLLKKRKEKEEGQTCTYPCEIESTS